MFPASFIPSSVSDSSFTEPPFPAFSSRVSTFPAPLFFPALGTFSSPAQNTEYQESFESEIQSTGEFSGAGEEKVPSAGKNKDAGKVETRSEEHTSELQSPS